MEPGRKRVAPFNSVKSLSAHMTETENCQNKRHSASTVSGRLLKQRVDAPPTPRPSGRSVNACCGAARRARAGCCAPQAAPPRANRAATPTWRRPTCPRPCGALEGVRAFRRRWAAARRRWPSTCRAAPCTEGFLSSSGLSPVHARPTIWSQGQPKSRARADFFMAGRSYLSRGNSRAVPQPAARPLSSVVKPCLCLLNCFVCTRPLKRRKLERA